MDAIKLNFKRDELPGLSRLVIIERKKRATDMNWLSREHAGLVRAYGNPCHTHSMEKNVNATIKIFSSLLLLPRHQHRKAQARTSFKEENLENGHPKQALQYPRREG